MLESVNARCRYGKMNPFILTKSRAEGDLMTRREPCGGGGQTPQESIERGTHSFDQKPTVSVLICTYQRHELLDQCLRSLVFETAEKPDELVIVNGGDERADEVARSFQASCHFPIRIIKTINKNLAVSRNVGLTHCQCDIIAMTDDDAKVFPDWITQIKRAHCDHPEAGAIGGSVIAANQEKFINRIANYTVFPAPPREGRVRTVPGVNASYKKRAIQEVGGYDESLFRGEDVDFNWRLREKGYEVYHDPRIGVYHVHRTSWLGLIRQIFMYGRAYYLVRKKWRDMYSIFPHQLKSGRDFLKAGYFLFGMFIEPRAWIKYQSKATDMVLGYPMGVVLSIAWRIGMIVQCLKCQR